MKNRIKSAAVLIGLTILGGGGNSYALQPAKPVAAKPVVKIKAPAISVASLVWTGVFGALEADPNTVYCLMGSGFLRSTTAPNLNALIGDWIKRHPTAKVVPVVLTGTAALGSANAHVVYVWVRDETGGTLNEYLVRQGACPGASMTIHISKDRTTGSKPEDFRVSKGDYVQFIKRVQVAEREAFQKKLGIWRKGGEEEKAAVAEKTLTKK